MSTITNILPYPIDVCVRTTPYPIGKGKKFKKNTKNNKNKHSLKGMGLSGLNVEETVFYAKNIDGKYSSEGAAREWSTVVDISIPPPSFQPVSLK